MGILNWFNKVKADNRYLEVSNGVIFCPYQKMRQSRIGQLRQHTSKIISRNKKIDTLCLSIKKIEPMHEL